MGLTTWRGDIVRKGDVTISKNYLNKKELDILNRIVTMYLDYAELQAMNHRQMFTKDWKEKLNSFLQFNNQEILSNAGSVTKEIADNLAIEKYEKYAQTRLEDNSAKDSDFDKAIKKLNK